MSAAGRGAVRRESDFYPTHAWCVHRMLEVVELPRGTLLEPCVGDGAILDACPGHCVWFTADVRETPYALHVVDFLSVEPADRQYAAVITNPPYSQALEFVQHSMKFAPVVIMLLRLNFLGGGKRSEWLRENPPDVYVLPNRPSFDGKGTDACEYAWFVWGMTEGGHFQILRTTPKEERRRG